MNENNGIRIIGILMCLICKGLFALPILPLGLWSVASPASVCLWPAFGCPFACVMWLERAGFSFACLYFSTCINESYFLRFEIPRVVWRRACLFALSIFTAEGHGTSPQLLCRERRACSRSSARSCRYHCQRRCLCCRSHNTQPS